MVMIRLTAHFAGRVQGVGFRYTTCRVARRFDVTGYVMNLNDGRVKCVAEGRSAQVKAFVADVQEAMAGHITQTHIDQADATGQFTDFGVRH